MATRFDEYLPGGLVPDSEATPRISLIVASTERSGSSMLCHAMAATGRLGAPNEYFLPLFQPELRAGLGLGAGASPAEIAAALRRLRTSANGVFAVNLHYTHLHAFRNAAGLLAAFPDARFVLNTREDALDQAISYARAVQTRRWGADRKGGEGGPRYDHSLIDALLRKTTHENAGWARVIAQTGRPVLRLRYEEVRADLPAALRRIADFAEVELPPEAVPEQPPLRAQSRPGDNDDWRARYRADAARAGFESIPSPLPRIPRRARLRAVAARLGLARPAPRADA